MRRTQERSAAAATGNDAVENARSKVSEMQRRSAPDVERRFFQSPRTEARSPRRGKTSRRSRRNTPPRPPNHSAAPNRDRDPDRDGVPRKGRYQEEPQEARRRESPPPVNLRPVPKREVVARLRTRRLRGFESREGLRISEAEDPGDSSSNSSSRRLQRSREHNEHERIRAHWYRGPVSRWERDELAHFRRARNKMCDRKQENAAVMERV